MRYAIIIAAMLLLSGCSTLIKPSPVIVDKPTFSFQEPKPLELQPVNMTYKDNLIYMTPEEYVILQKNLADMKQYMGEEKQVIEAYKKYYLTPTQ